MNLTTLKIFLLSIILSTGGFNVNANGLPTFKCLEPHNHMEQCVLENIHLNKTHFKFNIEATSPLQIKWITVYESTIPVLTSEICNKFPNVENIDLQNIKIEDILEDAFYNCKKVKSVLLNGNRLSKLLHSTFDNNQEIERLEMQYNQIRSIGNPATQYHNLPKLKVLLLHKNYLKEFNSMLFRFSENLEVLNLASNDLFDIDEMDLLESFKHLSSIAYNDNQLSCHRVVQINGAFENAGVKISRVDYYNTRFYDVEVYQNIKCLSDTVWLNARERSDKTY